MAQTCAGAVLAAQGVQGERTGSAQPGSCPPGAADAAGAVSVWGKLC